MMFGEEPSDNEEVEDYDEDWDEEVSGSSDDDSEESVDSDDGGDVRMKTVQETEAEEAIEGDFDRLVKGIRLHDTSSSSSSTGLLAKDWDFDLEEREAEFRDDLRAASGVGKRRRKRGRTSGPVLSQQVKSLLGDGNQAFVDNNILEAIRIMHEVIRIEPRAVGGWSVLAQCYEVMDAKEKALQLRIIAAHLRHDVDEWERLAHHSRDLGYNKQALYCYSKMSSLDPTNVDILWDKATLAKELGDFRTAKNAFMSILKRVPHDLTVLRELHTILMELSDLGTCKDLLQQAFDHHMNAFPGGHGLDAVTGLVVPGGGFSKLDLLLLADLYNALGQFEDAIHTIRRGTRWLQGRMDQRYWDLCPDDREFDKEGGPPRPSTGEANPVQPGHYELDTNARHRLAVARIKMGDIEEGKSHADIVLLEDVLDYSVLFAEIADAFYEREMYAEAKPIYELLGGDAATSSIYILLQTAACMRNVDELKEAAEVYEHIRLADPNNNDAKMKLAEVYEIMGEPRKALDLVYEVIDSRRKTRNKNPQFGQSTEPTPAAGTSLFVEEKTSKNKGITVRTQNRLNHAQLRELEAQKEKEVVNGYKRLTDHWTGMLSGDAEAHRLWMMEAERLVDMFRETRNLFLTTRSNPFRGMFPRSKRREEQKDEDEERMVSRLQLDLERDTLSRRAKGDKPAPVNVFRGVHFDDWLRIFMQYCFIITREGRFEDANEILRHIMVSNAYQSKERQDSIRLAIITCAIYAVRHDVVVEQCRKLIGTYQFNNEPLRILLASLASGLRITDSFITSTLQKHLFREMKLWHAAVNNPDTIKWSSQNKRYAPVLHGKMVDPEEGGEEEEEGLPSALDATSGDKARPPPLPTKENPVIVAIYGQICIAAKSYQSAIFYLLHAYDYYPNDPMICLCLAIASMGRAMQRQSDNRHHLVVQAMAFLSQYRKLRGTTDAGAREVEYNFGRTFHQLGLYSHAVKHYERVLDLADKAGDNLFAQEAAYNLSMIYVFTGAKPLADALYRRWLSF